MNLIRLCANQRRVKQFEHPAFKDVKPVSQEALADLVEARLDGGPTEPLILALRSTARYLIGRYMWHYPSCRRFLDEMVGEAMLAVTMLVSHLERDMLIDSNIQKLASSRIRGRIEECLNELQGVAAPCLRTQLGRLADGLKPDYLVSEREPKHEDKENPDAEEEKSDMLDALEVLRGECEMAALILDPDNWGLDDKELAEKLGCTYQYANRCRRNLLSQFLKLTGESE